MRHLAMHVRAFEEMKQFYVALLGFRVEWEPDPNNLYLTSGTDNLAFHRVPDTGDCEKRIESTLDHLGLVVRTPEEVDRWASYLEGHGVVLVKQPRAHRDGARSFYFRDPDGNQIQIIYHPPISGG